MKTILTLLLGMFFLNPFFVQASPPPPPQTWERFLAADQVVLAEIVGVKPETAQLKVLEMYKGDGLKDVIEINLQRSHWNGGAYSILYEGDKVIAFLKATSQETLGKLKTESIQNPKFVDPPTSKPEVYDLLWNYDPFMGDSLIVVTDKTPHEIDLLGFLSKIYKSKDDQSKFDLIQNELENDSALVDLFSILFTTQRYSFVGYVSDPKSLKTWLPVEGNVLPKSLSEAASKYLTKHLADLDKNPYKLNWLVKIIVQNYDDAAEKTLFDIVKNQPLSSSAQVSLALLQTAFKDDVAKKQLLMAALTPRMQEAADSLSESPDQSYWTAHNAKESSTLLFLVDSTGLAVDLNTKDEAVIKAIKTWVQKTPWHDTAIKALTKLNGASNIDLLNTSALRTRDESLMKEMAEKGDVKTLNIFLERISKGSPWGDNYEGWDFEKLGPAIITLVKRLGGDAKEKAVQAYMIYLARWHVAHLSQSELSGMSLWCQTDKILPPVIKTLSDLTGKSFSTPEEWLQWSMASSKAQDVGVYCQTLLKDAGDYFVATDGVFASNDCRTGKPRSMTATEKAPTDVYQGYKVQGTTVETNMVLKDNFPFNEGLKQGKPYKVVLTVDRMIEFPAGDFRARYKAKNGKYYDTDVNIESCYAGIQNEKGEIEIVNSNWIAAESVENFWSAYRSGKPADLAQFERIFPFINHYGVPPITPSYNNYMVLRFKEPVKVKINALFPSKDVFVMDQEYDVSIVYVKVNEGFGASGRQWYMKNNQGQYMDIDRRGVHYILIPTVSGAKALLDTRWVGRSLSLDKLDRNPFVEQKGLLDDFSVIYVTKDRFDHP